MGVHLLPRRHTARGDFESLAVNELPTIVVLNSWSITYFYATEFSSVAYNSNGSVSTYRPVRYCSPISFLLCRKKQVTFSLSIPRVFFTYFDRTCQYSSCSDEDYAVKICLSLFFEVLSHMVPVHLHQINCAVQDGVYVPSSKSLISM